MYYRKSFFKTDPSALKSIKLGCIKRFHWQKRTFNILSVFFHNCFHRIFIEMLTHSTQNPHKTISKTTKAIYLALELEECNLVFTQKSTKSNLACSKLEQSGPCISQRHLSFSKTYIARPYCNNFKTLRFHQDEVNARH